MTPSKEQQFTHILSRINSLEQRFIDLIVPIQNIAGGKALIDLGNLLSRPLLIDDRGLQSTLKDLRETINDFEGKFSSENVDKIFEVIQKAKFHDLYEMLMWQSKHIKDIEMKLMELIEKPPERKVKVDISVDGQYQTIDVEKDDQKNKENKYVSWILNEKHIQVFEAHTKNDVKHPFNSIAKSLNMSPASVGLLWKQILKSCRKDKILFKILLGRLSKKMKLYFNTQINGD